jgi:hypothetical protein
VEFLPGFGVMRRVDDEVRTKPGCGDIRAPQLPGQQGQRAGGHDVDGTEVDEASTSLSSRDRCDGFLTRMGTVHPIGHHAGLVRQLPVEFRLGRHIPTEMHRAIQVAAECGVRLGRAGEHGSSLDTQCQCRLVGVIAQLRIDVKQTPPPSGMFGAAYRPVKVIEARPGSVTA